MSNTTRENQRKSGQAMNDNQIVAYLGRKILAAMNNDDDELSDARKENFNYYVGAEYGNERDGYSRYVTREAMETIEWVLPSILRVFLSGDKIAAFTPNQEDDEAAAAQETDATNYFVMQANNDGEGGFLPMHHWIKDALMYPNGYIKVFPEEKEFMDVSLYSGLTAPAVHMIAQDPNAKIVGQRSDFINVPMPTDQGTEIQRVEIFDLKVEKKKKRTILRIEPVPPEECLVSHSCTSINLDESDFVAHRKQKSYSELVAEGYDRKELDLVGEPETYDFGDEKVNRLFYADENPYNDDSDEQDPSTRKMWVHECSVEIDVDGDGIAERRRIVLIGDKLFDNEIDSYQPMVAMSSILMPHKHTGMCYIDIMKDLQLLMSVLTRQLLDNVYKINVRRKVFSEDALTEDGSTMEALLNVQAEFIPVRGPAQNAFVPEPTQSIVGELLPVIQYFNEAKAQRTGVVPEASVDANALQEIREDVFNNALDRASQRIEMLVRIFAETGFRQLMLKTHRVLRSHWDVARMVKLRGKWVDVDPQGWQERTEMTVNVGLGFNTKKQQLLMLRELLTVQKEALQGGLTNYSKMYNALEKMINASNIGDVSMYFIDPNSPEYKPPPQPQPDANMILAQAQAQALGQEQQRKGQEVMINAQNGRVKTQLDAQLKQEEIKLKRVDQQIRMRELILKEKELERDGVLKTGEVEARIRNIEADTELKKSTSDKTMVEATVAAVEASETYQQALHVVSEMGEVNANGERSEGADNTEENDAQETGTDD